MSTLQKVAKHDRISAQLILTTFRILSRLSPNTKVANEKKQFQLRFYNFSDTWIVQRKSENNVTHSWHHNGVFQRRVSQIQVRDVSPCPFLLFPAWIFTIFSGASNIGRRLDNYSGFFIYFRVGDFENMHVVSVNVNRMVCGSSKLI